MAESEPAVDLRDWQGTLRWVEFVESDVGSDQTLVHDLTIGPTDDPDFAFGTFSQDGFQTFTRLNIAFTTRIDGIAAEVAGDFGGATPADVGLIVFRITGTPDDFFVLANNDIITLTPIVHGAIVPFFRLE